MGVAACAASAIAQDIPAAVMEEDVAPAEQNGSDIPAPIFSAEDDGGLTGDTLAVDDSGTASERMFRAQQNNENGSEVDKILAGVLTELNADCPAVEQYQTFNKNRQFVSMKVKCAERATYAITLGPVSLGVISGGDGSVGRIDPDDGDVRVLDGEAPRAGRRVSSSDSPISLRALAIGGGVLLALLASWIFYMVRRSKIIAPWRGLRSEDKDRMLEESELIWPDIYRHSSGLWFARGKRGKRRLFRNQIFAWAYARYNLKFFQIR
ncbi:MAG: hypothetical protein WA979_00275 [Pacificimonas sp.]